MKRFLIFIGSILGFVVLTFGISYFLGLMKQAFFGPGETVSGVKKSAMVEGLAIFVPLSIIGVIVLLIVI